MISDPLSAQLQQGVDAMGLTAADLPLQSYVAYVELLVQWNKAYNLTAIRQPEKMVSYHVLDSLPVLPYIRGNLCLDIGSGAGLPGLILALARPEKSWVLLDSNGKKIRFINQAVMELGLNNVEVVYCRIENFTPGTQFSTIITRAWGTLSGYYQVARGLLQPSGCLLAMKGPGVNTELTDMETIAMGISTHILDVPGVEGERNLVEISALPSSN